MDAQAACRLGRALASSQGMETGTGIQIPDQTRPSATQCAAGALGAPSVTAALVAEPASLEKRLRQGNGRLAGFSNATDLEDVFKRIEAQYIDTEHSE